MKNIQTPQDKANKSLASSHKQTNAAAWQKVEASMTSMHRTHRTGIDPNSTVIYLNH